MKDVLLALERNESVTIFYRGKEKPSCPLPDSGQKNL